MELRAACFIFAVMAGSCSSDVTVPDRMVAACEDTGGRPRTGSQCRDFCQPGEWCVPVENDLFSCDCGVQRCWDDGANACVTYCGDHVNEDACCQDEQCAWLPADGDFPGKCFYALEPCATDTECAEGHRCHVVENARRRGTCPGDYPQTPPAIGACWSPATQRHE